MAEEYGVTLRQLDRVLWIFDRDLFRQNCTGEARATKGGGRCRIGT